MNRRGFLGSILALGAAPAIVRADSLMRIIAPETVIIFEAGVYDLMSLDMITAEVLRIAHDKARFIGTINRRYASDFALHSEDVIRSKMPHRYLR